VTAEGVIKTSKAEFGGRALCALGWAALAMQKPHLENSLFLR
jgi:hypothetical protein